MPVNVDKLPACESNVSIQLVHGKSLQCTLHSLMSAVCIIASQECFGGKFIELSSTEALFDLEFTRGSIQTFVNSAYTRYAVLMARHNYSDLTPVPLTSLMRYYIALCAGHIGSSMLAGLTIIIHISACLPLPPARYNGSVREQKNLCAIVEVYLDFRSSAMRAYIITCTRVRTLCLHYYVLHYAAGGTPTASISVRRLYRLLSRAGHECYR